MRGTCKKAQNKSPSDYQVPALGAIWITSAESNARAHMLSLEHMYVDPIELISRDVGSNLLEGNLNIKSMGMDDQRNYVSFDVKQQLN